MSSLVVESRDQAAPQGANTAARLMEAKQVILLVTDDGAVSNSLIFALEREFPWLVIERVDGVESICRDFSHPVALILLDWQRLKSAEEISAPILNRHPRALVAMVEPDAHNPACSFPEIQNSPLVRGVLPMNLALDVWLSIVRLLLRGGEYFPPAMLHTYAKEIDAGASAVMPAAPEPPAGAARLTDLTPREMQILSMVSRGLQNKQIAVQFRLSENTVKIHIHHIISKLGTHNRTEAAARFRDFEARRQTSPAPSPDER